MNSQTHTNKRFFEPSSGTSLGNIKKRKLNSGIETIKPSIELPLSSEEQELIEIEEAKREFERQKLINMVTYRKSQRYTRPSFSSCTTVPEPFSLQKSQSHACSQLSTEEKEWVEIRSRPKFKARPIPASTENPKLPTAQLRPLTIPVEFKLSTPKKKTVTEDSSVSNFKAKPVPSFEKPFTPKLQNRRTSQQPFHLKSQERKTDYQEKLHTKLENMQLQEQENRNFKSRPVPQFPEPKMLRSQRPLTLPSPFPLSSSKATEITEQKPSPFKARPMPDLSKAFVPTVKNKHTTAPQEFYLNSDSRAEQRALFQETLKEKQRKKEMDKQFEVQLSMQLEKEEIRLLRSDAEFKARPMPEYKYFEVRRCSNDLTIPKAPEFNNRLDSKASFASEGSTLLPSDSSVIEDTEMME